MISARAQRAIRRDAVREQQEASERRELSMRQNRAGARSVHSGVMVREQTVGRIIPTTGRTVRQLSGRISPPPWITLFINMLTHMLSGRHFWNDIRMTVEYSGETNSYHLIIVSNHERVTHPGVTRGMFRIIVRDNEPRYGFCTESLNERNWARGNCINNRRIRVSFRPLDEITQWITPVQTEFGEILKFRDFLSWEHGVYLTLAAHYALYHTDFNISYPVVKIISNVIVEHYRLAEADHDDHVSD